MRRLMAGLRKERGASAVIFGLLLVPLFGMLAISVDVGGLYAEKAQLQNGADAAALAVAYQCAVDAGACTGSSAIASQYAAANALDGFTTSLTPTIDRDVQTVQVDVHTENEDSSDGLKHPFAALLGFDSTTVPARAIAIYGRPTAGNVIPLALSYCDFNASASGQLTLIQYDQNKTCTGPEGQPIEGGFGWLDQGQDECLAYIDLDDATVGSDPGLDPPQNCETLLERLRNATTPAERTVYLPIYKCNPDLAEDGCSNGSNGQQGEFIIWQFAAFEVTGWMFSGVGSDLMYNPDPDAPGCDANPGGANPGSGNQGGGNQGGGKKDESGDAPAGDGNNCRGIQGKFTKYVSLEQFAKISATPSVTGLTGVALTG